MLFDKALNNHQTFVDGIPDISEKRMTICQNWRTQLETDHQMVMDEIDNHLAARSTTQSIVSKSAYSSAPSQAQGPAKETVEFLTQQLGLVQQQLASQGQQFQNVLFAVDESIKAAADMVSTPLNFADMLENFSKRIEENQRDQNENLRRYIDSTVGRVDSKVDEINN